MEGIERQIEFVGEDVLAKDLEMEHPLLLSAENATNGGVVVVMVQERKSESPGRRIAAPL